MNSTWYAEGNKKYLDICRVIPLKYRQTKKGSATKRDLRASRFFARYAIKGVTTHTCFVILLFVYATAVSKLAIRSVSEKKKEYSRQIHKIPIFNCSHAHAFHNSRWCYISRRLSIASEKAVCCRSRHFSSLDYCFHNYGSWLQKARCMSLVLLVIVPITKFSIAIGSPRVKVHISL